MMIRSKWLSISPAMLFDTLIFYERISAIRTSSDHVSRKYVCLLQSGLCGLTNVLLCVSRARMHSNFCVCTIPAEWQQSIVQHTQRTHHFLWNCRQQHRQQSSRTAYQRCLPFCHGRQSGKRFETYTNINILKVLRECGNSLKKHK